jgi:hypothetical protein
MSDVFSLDEMRFFVKPKKTVFFTSQVIKYDSPMASDKKNKIGEFFKKI